jgi:hypothetical protein
VCARARVCVCIQGRKLLAQGQWAAAATELEGALGVIKYLEPVATVADPRAGPIQDTEKRETAAAEAKGMGSPPKQPLLREVNLMAVSSSYAASVVGGVSVAKAARTLAVHCLLGLAASYYHMNDPQVRAVGLKGRVWSRVVS